MSLRDPLGALTIGPQSLAACYSLYQAVFDLDGPPAARALGFGVVLIIGAVAALTHRIKARYARSARERILEDQAVDLQRQVHELGRQIQAVRVDVDCRIVTAEWQRVFNRTATREGRRTLRVIKPEEA